MSVFSLLGDTISDFGEKLGGFASAIGEALGVADYPTAVNGGVMICQTCGLNVNIDDEGDSTVMFFAGGAPSSPPGAKLALKRCRRCDRWRHVGCREPHQCR